MNSSVRQITLRQKNECAEFLIRATLFCMAITILLVSTGCSSVDYRRLAYETLRQVDCKVNDLDDFCDRTFANEYHEYERMREDYLTNKTVKESWLGRDSDDQRR